MCSFKQRCRPDVTESYGTHSYSKVTYDQVECFWEVNVIVAKRDQGVFYKVPCDVTPPHIVAPSYLDPTQIKIVKENNY